MDFGTIIGLVAAVIMLVASVLTANGSFLGFLDVSAMIIVIGGVMCGVMIAFPLADVLKLPAVLHKVFFSSPRELSRMIDQIVSLAETARHDGLLALEGRVHELEEPFLVSGIRMAVDGLNPEIVESVMRTEMNATNTRHTIGRRIFSQLGKTAPMFGLISTLLGLVMMLGKMDPTTIGRHMSVALLGTFYGAVLANLLFIPMAEKLMQYNGRELEMMELIIMGVIAIQSGENPHVIRQRLSTFLPQKDRKSELP